MLDDGLDDLERHEKGLLEVLFAVEAVIDDVAELLLRTPLKNEAFFSFLPSLFLSFFFAEVARQSSVPNQN